MDTILAIKNLWGGYGKEPIIKDISLELEKGDFLGIIGPNGSGKSTLLKLASRALHQEQGSIIFEGKDIQQLPLKKFCQKVAFVPQDTLINFPFTVEEIVLMGRIPHLKRLQFETKRDFLATEEALALTDSLRIKNRKIDELSAGERQRVIIAKALAQEPILLFLDEPTAHLDIGHQLQILDLLQKLNTESHLTVVMVMHDLNLASEYSKRIILLKDGSIFKEGKPQEVLTEVNLENVYGRQLLVNKNPVSSKPCVLLVSGKKGRGVQCKKL